MTEIKFHHRSMPFEDDVGGILGEEDDTAFFDGGNSGNMTVMLEKSDAETFSRSLFITIFTRHLRRTLLLFS